MKKEAIPIEPNDTSPVLTAVKVEQEEIEDESSHVPIEEQDYEVPLPTENKHAEIEVSNTIDSVSLLSRTQSTDSCHSAELDHDYLSHDQAAKLNPTNQIKKEPCDNNIKCQEIVENKYNNPTTRTAEECDKKSNVYDHSNLSVSDCMAKNHSLYTGTTTVSHGGHTPLTTILKHLPEVSTPKQCQSNCWKQKLSAKSPCVDKIEPLQHEEMGSGPLTLPNPSLIQSGLQETLFLASFQSVSPTKSEEGEEPEREEDEPELLAQWVQAQNTSSQAMPGQQLGASGAATTLLHHRQEVASPAEHAEDYTSTNSTISGNKDGLEKTVEQIHSNCPKASKSKEKSEFLQKFGIMKQMSSNEDLHKSGPSKEEVGSGDVSRIDKIANDSARSAPRCYAKVKRKKDNSKTPYYKDKHTCSRPKSVSKLEKKVKKDKIEENVKSTTGDKVKKTKQKKTGQPAKETKCKILKQKVELETDSNDAISWGESEEDETVNTSKNKCKKTPTDKRKKATMKVKITCNRSKKSTKTNHPPPETNNNKISSVASSSKSKERNCTKSESTDKHLKTESGPEGGISGSPTRSHSGITKKAAARMEMHRQRRLEQLASEVFSATLAKWENYLRLSPGEIQEHEVESAREHGYTEEAVELITNTDLYVWQLLDDMTPKFDQHNLQFLPA